MMGITKSGPGQHGSVVIEGDDVRKLVLGLMTIRENVTMLANIAFAALVWIRQNAEQVNPPNPEHN